MKKTTTFFFVFLLLFLTLCSENEKKSSKNEILKHNEWNNIFREYSVDPSLVSLLKNKINKIDTIKVYFAFWCGDSRNNVPKFIKLIDLIDPDKIEITYISVGRKTDGAKYFVSNLKILRVPTFIFFNNGKEIGRIVENPVKSLPEDILNIIF